MCHYKNPKPAHFHIAKSARTQCETHFWCKGFPEGMPKPSMNSKKEAVFLKKTYRVMIETAQNKSKGDFLLLLDCNII